MNNDDRDLSQDIRITELQGEINVIKSEITNMKTLVDEVRKDISGLGARVSQNEVQFNEKVSGNTIKVLAWGFTTVVGFAASIVGYFATK